jgi:hypothetical protein
MTNNIQYTRDGMIVHGDLVSWDTIDNERNKIRFANHVLVKIYWHNRRSQGFDDNFIMSKEEWAKWKERLIGSTINFGEIDGKHSEVYGIVSEQDITITDDLNSIVLFYYNYGRSSGRVDFIKQYTTHVLDGDIEDPVLLLEQYPEVYNQQYPNGHKGEQND